MINDTCSKGCYVDEPGDERFDIEGHSQGVCTDIRYDFQHTGCESRAGAAAVIGLVGCTANLGWARAYCGAIAERVGSDFLDTYISESSLAYPRVLVPAGVVNGIAVQEVTCEDETGCVNKCELFNRRARSGGLPAPESCALCNSVCPSNIGTTIVDTISALNADISTALKIARVCLGELGFGACICNVFLLLKPAWINNLPSPQERCQGGNIFGLLVTKIVQLIARLADDAINGIIIDPLNDLLDKIPFVGKNTISRACLSGPFNPPRYDCQYGPINNQDLLGCYDSNGHEAQHQCYFTRQRSICLDDGDRYPRYQDLFKAPDAADLNAQYQDIVGGSYEFLGPSFQSLMTQVSSQTQEPDVAAAMNLCDSSLFDSMDLDEVRTRSNPTPIVPFP